MSKIDMIKFKDFVRVINTSLTHLDINEGDVLFVAGTQQVPEDKEDIYNLRVKLISCLVKDKHIISDKFLLVDPRNVERVSESKQQKLERIMEEDFKKYETSD